MKPPHTHADPRDPAFFENPYAFYEATRALGAFFHWKEYGHLCAAGFAEVNALLRDRRLGRQITGDEFVPAPKPHLADFDQSEKYSLLALEPPDHTRLRGLVNHAFFARHVEQLRPRVERLAHELIDGFLPHGRVELLKAYAAPIPAVVIAEMIGLPAEMATQLLHWSNRMVAMYAFGVTEATEHDANAAAADFIRYLRRVLEERRIHPREDLLSHLLAAEIDGEKLGEEEIISTTILLLNAGHEATVHTTGNAVKTILESGLDTQSLFATEEQTAKTVEECLRFDAPLHMFKRYALQDLELEGGWPLRKGDVIGLLLGAANRDPRRFAEPAHFDPARADGGHVSFGAGIHFCVGAPLARIELQVMLKTLFQRLPSLHLAEPPHYADNFHFHGLQRLDVAW